MVYTDGVHLVSDCGNEDLHYFARQIGLEREWFQAHPRHPHYDLQGRMVDKALRAGAAFIGTRALVALRTIREDSVGCETCHFCTRPD